MHEHEYRGRPHHAIAGDATVAEAAAKAKISKRYTEMRIAAGNGPDVTRIGRRVLIRDDRLDAWLDQLTVGPDAHSRYLVHHRRRR